MTSWWLLSFVFFLHNLISFQYKSVGSSNPYTYSPSYAPQADVGPLNKENKRKTDQTLSLMLFYPSTVSMKQLKHFILKNAMSSLAIPVSFRQILVNYYPWHFYTLTITPLFTEVRFRNQGNLSGQKNVAKTSRRWRVKPGLRFFALEPLEWNQKRNPGAWEEPIKWFYSQVCSNLLP